MANYKINDCKTIVYNGHRIKKVIYCDNRGIDHHVWPGSSTIENIRIVKISGQDHHDEGSKIAYSNPFIVEPNTEYAIITDLKRWDYNQQNIIVQLKDCYNFKETMQIVSGPDNAWGSYDGPGYTRTCKDVNGNPIPNSQNDFSTWKCTNTDPNVTPAIEIQSGWVDNNGTYAQQGYIFDTNYTSPIIFQRDTIIAQNNLYTDYTHQSLQPQTGNRIQVGDTITFYPAIYKYGYSTGWQSFEDITFVHISYSNSFRVSENNGTYTITALAPTNNEEVIKLYTVYDSTDHTYDQSIDIRIQVFSNRIYRVLNGVTEVSSEGITIDDVTALTVQYCDNPEAEPINRVWNTYSGIDLSVTTQNTNVISITGTTITPIEYGSTATVTVSVGQSWSLTFPVTVDNSGAISYKYGPIVNGAINYSTNALVLDQNSTANWTISSTSDELGISFITSGGSGRPVHFDNNQVYTSDNVVIRISPINPLGSYSFTATSVPLSGDTLDLDIWKTSDTSGNPDGRITINFN